jgi:esterase/lipase
MAHVIHRFLFTFASLLTMPTPFWASMAASVASSLIVGLVAAYLTANKTLATLQTRVDDNEDSIQDLEDSQDAFQEGMSEVKQRLARIEALLEVVAGNQDNVNLQ